MKMKGYYWTDDDTMCAFFGDVHKEKNLTIARESEYHSEDDEVVIIDVFWDDDDNMTEGHSINPSTLKYYEKKCKIDPNITREEYDEIVTLTRAKAKETTV